MKVTWKVAPPPTGRYRSFEKRGWPFATYKDDKSAALIACDDEYVPSKVATGDHKELTVRIADYTAVTGGSYTWRTMKARFKTLKDAKDAVEAFLTQNPTFCPKDQK